jgi:hypothetical protein
MQLASRPYGRFSHLVCLLAVPLIFASPQAANATAIGNAILSPAGFAGPDAGFSLLELGTFAPADGLQITYTTLSATSSTFVSGAGNVAIAAVQPIKTDGRSHITIGTSIDVIASTPGEALAQVTQVVVATVLNTLGESNVFDLFGYYGINTGIFVDDLSRESVFAVWDVGVFIAPTRLIGEGPRVINCDLETFTPHACPNFYDNNSGHFGPRSLGPGDSIDVVLTTNMTLHATVVPEPASLALLTASCIGLAAWRRRHRAAP